MARSTRFATFAQPAERFRSRPIDAAIICREDDQSLSGRKLAGDVGPGWEYYLDMLVAVRERKALPSFEDYYPSQKAHYLEGA